MGYNHSKAKNDDYDHLTVENTDKSEVCESEDSFNPSSDHEEGSVHSESVSESSETEDDLDREMWNHRHLKIMDLSLRLSRSADYYRDGLRGHLENLPKDFPIDNFIKANCELAAKIETAKWLLSGAIQRNLPDDENLEAT